MASASEAERLASEIQTSLHNGLRLHREAALQKLEQLLHDTAAVEQDAFRLAMCALDLQLLSSDAWQHRLGGFDAAQVDFLSTAITFLFIPCLQRLSGGAPAGPDAGATSKGGLPR